MNLAINTGILLSRISIEYSYFLFFFLYKVSQNPKILSFPQALYQQPCYSVCACHHLKSTAWPLAWDRLQWLRRTAWVGSCAGPGWLMTSFWSRSLCPLVFFWSFLRLDLTAFLRYLLGYLVKLTYISGSHFELSWLHLCPSQSLSFVGVSVIYSQWQRPPPERRQRGSQHQPCSPPNYPGSPFHARSQRRRTAGKRFPQSKRWCLHARNGHFRNNKSLYVARWALVRRWRICATWTRSSTWSFLEVPPSWFEIFNGRPEASRCWVTARESATSMSMQRLTLIKSSR